MPKAGKKLTRAQAEDRIELLTDRLAVLLVVVRKRYNDDWNPWGGEGMWEDADGMGEVIREWPDYKAARDVVGLFISRSEK